MSDGHQSPDMESCEWDAVVLTCTRSGNAQLFRRELERRQRQGFIDRKTVILAADDPDTPVGSGGATLNALLIVTEYLSALAGHTVVSADVLTEARILIMHLGSAYLCDPCGKGFTTFAATQRSDTHQGLLCNVDHLLRAMDRLGHG